MTGTAMMNKFFDKYSIAARLFPALLFVLPILFAAMVIFPKLLSGFRNSSLFALAIVGVMYFISSVARSRGKAVEKELLRVWGGWPSTIMLRHRDTAIDPLTKARYHQALEKMTGKPLPSEAEEEA